MSREARILGALLQEASEPLSWWYLSFTDGALPNGSQFLGAVVVEARGMAGAITEAHRQGINPGGGVMVIQLPEGKEPLPEDRGRLLSRHEATNMALRDK